MSEIRLCDLCGLKIEGAHIRRDGQDFHDPGCWQKVQAAFAEALAKVRPA